MAGTQIGNDNYPLCLYASVFKASVRSLIFNFQQGLRPLSGGLRTFFLIFYVIKHIFSIIVCIFAASNRKCKTVLQNVRNKSKDENDESKLK
jgi:hypothetical protein